MEGGRFLEFFLENFKLKTASVFKNMIHTIMTKILQVIHFLKDSKNFLFGFY